jgi:integrase
MASIRKRTLPSGRVVWQADYLDGGGKRRSKHFDRKTDADGYLVKIRHDVSRGLHVADSQSITVADAGKLWIERAERDGLERSTVNQYVAHLKHHITPEIGTVKLSALTPPRVNQFADKLLETRSRVLARKVLTSLGSLIDEAMRRGLAAHNPVRAVKIRNSSREDEGDAVEMPTRDELRAILNTVSGRWRPLIVTTMFTGLRGSEIRGLTWPDVDLKAGVLRVRRRADSWGRFGSPKSKAGKRDIALAPIVLNALREWKLACPVTKENLVFPAPSGGILSHACILKDGFWPLQIAAGVVTSHIDKESGKAVLDAKYSLHALRHAAAAMFIEQGFGPKKVQTLMGHGSIRLTYDTYGYLFKTEDEDRAGMAQIEARLLS